MDVTKQFGRNLRASRIQRHISQEDLAELSGLHRTYISGLERGLRNPTITVVSRLAQALNVAPGDLFGVNETS